MLGARLLAGLKALQVTRMVRCVRSMHLRSANSTGFPAASVTTSAWAETSSVRRAESLFVDVVAQTQGVRALGSAFS